MNSPRVTLRWRSVATAPRAARYMEGVWAALLAMVPAWLLSALLRVPTPLEPLAQAIMLLTPVALANTLLEALGPFARAAGLLGAIAVALLVGGLLALVGPRAWPAEGLRVAWRRMALVAGLALAAALPLWLGSAYAGERLSTLVLALAYPPALLLVGRVHGGLRTGRPPTAEARGASALPRRALLAAAPRVGLVALAVGLGAFDLWAVWLTQALGRGEVRRRLFPFVPPAPRAPGFPVAQMEPEVSPLTAFYRLSKNDVDPVVEPADWALRITGAVARPLTISYAALLAMPRTDRYVTLRCVNNLPSGRLMSTALWSGVPLADLLHAAGVDAQAATAVLLAPDAYEEVLPLAVARDPETLVAYGMNGETLPRVHGGPVRLVAPGYFGFKNVKWLEQVRVSAAPVPGYWARHGWTATRVHSVARIDVWTAQPGGVLVAGVAFTGDRGVSAVQVRADGGAWQAADLNAPALARTTWVQWRAALALAPGQHLLAARVLDGAGTPQVEAANNLYPGGATGLHTLRITL